jgi:hypothetical protein
MTETRFSKKLVWLTIIFFVHACGFQPADSSNPSVEEIIAGTAVAAQTQTAINLPSATATYTSTATTTPFFPSATPTATFPFGIFVESPLTSVVVETPDESFIISAPTSDPALGSIKYTDHLWACAIVSKSPSKDSVVKGGSDFYVAWTIVNTGTRAWTNNGVDFVYDSGFRHEGGPIQDMPRLVPRGGKITLKVLIVTPKNEGTYNVIWSLQVGITMFCHMKVSFVVK